MTLAARIGDSFASEFRRPETQIFILGSCLFLATNAIDANHHWTAATRPFWIGALLCISPISMIPSQYPTTTWKGSRRRILTGLGVGVICMLEFYSLEKKWPQAPGWVWICLALVEAGLLLWARPMWLGKSPEQADLDGGSDPCH